MRHVPTTCDFDPVLHPPAEMKRLVRWRDRYQLACRLQVDDQTADRIAFVRWLVDQGRLELES